MARYVVDVSAKVVARRHRSLHVNARTEEEAIRKTKEYFKKSLESRGNRIVSEIRVDDIVDFGGKG